MPKTRARQPKGIPSGGEFSQMSREESGISLTSVPYVTDVWEHPPRLVFLSDAQIAANRNDWDRSPRASLEDITSITQSITDTVEERERLHGLLEEQDSARKKALDNSHEALVRRNEAMSDINSAPEYALAVSAAERIVTEVGRLDSEFGDRVDARAKTLVSSSLSETPDDEIPPRLNHGDFSLAPDPSFYKKVDSLRESGGMTEEFATLDGLRDSLAGEHKSLASALEEYEMLSGISDEAVSQLKTTRAEIENGAERERTAEAELKSIQDKEALRSWGMSEGPPRNGKVVPISSHMEIPLGDDGGWNAWIVGGGRIVDIQQVEAHGQQQPIGFVDAEGTLAYAHRHVSNSWSEERGENGSIWIAESPEESYHRAPVRSGTLDSGD